MNQERRLIPPRSVLGVLGVILLLGSGAALGMVWGLAFHPPDAIGYRERDESIDRSVTSFESGGKPITVERYAPRSGGKHPVVVVVHGADGLQFERWTQVYQGLAQQLARRGYVALMIHYFDRTGTRFGDDATNRANFLTWMQTLGDAVTFAGRQPDVAPDRIGLLGVSLGAYLSLTNAMIDARVKAVAEYFGGLPELAAATLRRMPPTLILHGDADPIVPVEEAHKLRRLFDAKQIRYELKIYPGQGHGFTRDEARDAIERCLRFFDTHLRPDDSKSPAE
ncbi:MAG: dienelactone hydrolase family protein [Planctomycetaceae bacterium]|nr:dienelactone hydrolase family protein [Planctomycetaceae bacterium]